MRKHGEANGRIYGVQALLFAFALLSCMGCANSSDQSDELADLRDEAVAKLREVMKTQNRWVKVHAAEWLLDLGYPQYVADEFHRELDQHGDEPEYRIGIWRVLARIPRSEESKREWIDRIKAACVEPDSPDRVHATETLAKLRASLDAEQIEKVTDFAESADARLAAYARWLLAVSDREGRDLHTSLLIELFRAEDEESRQLAAYAFQHLGTLDDPTWKVLLEIAKSESDPLTKVRLQGAALMATPKGTDISDLEEMRAEVLQRASNADHKLRGEVVRIFAEVGSLNDIKWLRSHLRPPALTEEETEAGISAASDLSAAAANAILRIERRSRSHSLHKLDWIVIAGYALMMIGVGLYYSRRTKNREDFLLGGRTMRPWMVGISLFATIISTISYLAYPGEMIQYGPMVFAGMFVLPIAYIIVGWWLIPSLMSLSSASGYALLEERLGVTVRLLGALIFLLLRIVWMATILYATADVALLPVLGVGKEYLPLICMVLGCITLGYTSMGGLRAVVMTDVIQSFILFGGALIALFLVTYHFGGLQWFPTQWVSHWPDSNFGLGLHTRMTAINVSVALLAWFICTCGSDQMAIQRYRATGGIAAARRSFGVSLIATFLVKVLLAIVGLAVMAYFIDQPQLLPDQTTVHSSPDHVFPRFIVVGIPRGLTGLVIAGMLAAAMSSLSSGISASASVISDDFVRRFRGLPADETAKLAEERWISIAVGIVAVGLSLGVDYVPGNLFEITTRAVNALVAPLFILFFMAIFVPWANSFGTIVGLIVSIVVAVAISLFEVWQISMMWIVPGSMFAGIAAGCLASLVPIGVRRR